jgi:alpha-L-fucosidase 2
VGNPRSVLLNDLASPLYHFAMLNHRFSAVLFILMALPLLARAQQAPLTLWFNKPAAYVKGHGQPTLINEALPIGNARIGALIQGEPGSELLRLNEDSLWTGSSTVKGAYQLLADLAIALPDQADAADYRRDLDLSRALAHVTFTSHGVHYQREFFASHPAQVIVVHLTADKPGSYTGSISLTDAHDAHTTASDGLLLAAGQLPRDGLNYETQVAIKNDGGSQQVNGNSIDFKGCDSLTLIIGAGTDYAMDFQNHYRGEAPHAKVTQQVHAAAGRSYDSLKTEHISDFQSLFNRCTLDLGSSSDSQRALPSDERKKLASEKLDPELEALVFQYGRYLMISCSRPGALPANLQGLWNDSLTPAWDSDYHANINVQMNYWPVEVTNLAECHLPLFDLVDSQVPVWREVTATSKDLLTPDRKLSTRGWAIRTEHNIFGQTNWKWDRTANAWYCQHYWEHYAFSLDKAFLAKIAYPVMKETCQYWEDHLKTLPDGRLVVPNGWSPEHGPVQDGVSYNQEIVWDLFNNYVQAAAVLDVDHDYAQKVKQLRNKLVTPGIGSWGQLLEWMTELHDPKNPELDTPNDHHRHTSHLFGVFPGRQISEQLTPKLAAAALVSLKARGNQGDVREWSYAWRTALYARLQDPADAHDQVMHFIGATTPNLFGNHPPMQMDGNFGITAGIAEMLLQSHEGDVHLLPALPSDWPTGSVRGLRARGGFEISMDWSNGALTHATVHSTLGGKLQLRYADQSQALSLSPGQTIDFHGKLTRQSQ